MKHSRKSRMLLTGLALLLSVSLAAACAPATPGVTGSSGSSEGTTADGSQSLPGETSRETESTASESSDGTVSEPSAEPTTEPATEPTTVPSAEPSPQPGTGLRADQLKLEDYASYKTDELSWWYRRPEPLNQEVRAGVDPGIAAYLEAHNGIWQDTVTEDKVIYLTSDAGYEYETNTAEILDILAEKGVPANFFITGAYMDASPDVVRRMLAEGHLVGNHTLNHKNPVQTLNNEGIYEMAIDIEANADKFKALTGQEMAPFLRPGQGVYSEQVLAIYKDMGYVSVFWDFAYRDWIVDDQPALDAAFAQITGELHPGSVMLLHAVSDTNVALMGDIIDYALEKGYTFRRLDQFPGFD